MSRFSHYVLVSAVFLSCAFISCRKENDKINLSVEFTHSVGNKIFIKDSLQYINTAGNHYEVNELQYFISDIVLHQQDGNNVAIQADSGIHYVDIDIPGSLLWNFDQQIPKGNYTSVSFTFGMNEAKNKTGRFVNPPERDMFWPDIMGGGYHYMKMNGQWKDTLNQLSPFNFHMGPGMKEGGMGVIQNYFTVQVPNSGFNITSDANHRLILNMDIASWFNTPNLWDWNVIGGQIMQNQWAMEMAGENGADAFSCLWKVE